LQEQGNHCQRLKKQFGGRKPRGGSASGCRGMKHDGISLKGTGRMRKMDQTMNPSNHKIVAKVYRDAKSLVIHYIVER
jgi:hypothetical protein